MEIDLTEQLWLNIRKATIVRWCLHTVGQLLNKIKFLIIGSMCIMILFSYIIIYQPLKNELERSIQQNFIYSSEAVGYTVQSFINDSMDDASSLSSRTMIKQEIVEYKKGNVSLEELREYTKTKYNDGYQVFRSIAGAFRIVDGKIIAQVGNVDLTKVNYCKDISDVTPEMDLHKLLVTVYSPIKDNEILGYDVVFFDMSNILADMHKGNMLHEIYSANDVQKILLKGDVINTAEGEYLIIDSSNTWYIKHLNYTDAYFVASTSNSILYQTLNSILSNILISFPVILLILTLIIYFLTFGNFSKIVKNLEKTKDLYKEYASTDCLTNTFTRHYFNEYIGKVTNGLEIFGSSLVIVMIDVDNFKYINDTYGHLTGDVVLKAIAVILRSSIRNGDIVVRYGGDEFLLALKNCDIEKSNDILLRVTDRLGAIGEFNFNIEISFGIAEVKNKNEVLQAIREADAKMYEMKKRKV